MAITGSQKVYRYQARKCGRGVFYSSVKYSGKTTFKLHTNFLSSPANYLIYYYGFREDIYDCEPF